MQNAAAVDHSFHIYYLSERAISVEFGNEISGDLLQHINAFNKLVHEFPFAGFETAVPAYTTLTVFYDPLKVIRSELPGNDAFEKVSAYLIGLNNKPEKPVPDNGATITIPVCYGGVFGPDLEEVAAHHQLTTDEVISLHSSAVYKVYMIGFVPGFSYLGGMTAQLAMPRKGTPRKAVPAGSVGIAGQQTGIYPLETPGGWQIIGQTPLKMFDAHREQPSLLKAGDQVIFQPVSAEEFREVNS